MKMCKTVAEITKNRIYLIEDRERETNKKIVTVDRCEIHDTQWNVLFYWEYRICLPAFKWQLDGMALSKSSENGERNCYIWLLFLVANIEV